MYLYINIYFTFSSIVFQHRTLPTCRILAHIKLNHWLRTKTLFFMRRVVVLLCVCARCSTESGATRRWVALRTPKLVQVMSTSPAETHQYRGYGPVVT